MLRILYSLVALALAVSPLAMSQGGTAMAHAPAAEMDMAGGHCGDTQAPAEEDESSKAMLDCMGICSAIAAGDHEWLGRGHVLAAAIKVSNLSVLSGLHPESEPPPPRIS
jgi:hypothetical protein